MRKLNMFERILLVVGIFVLVGGYTLIHALIIQEGLSTQTAVLIFLWLILVLLVIVAAVAENMKEEIKVITANQTQEIKLLRDDMKRSR